MGLIENDKDYEDQAEDYRRIKVGGVYHFTKIRKEWTLTQLPEVESALIAMDPNSGEINALVGGFDFQKNKFNHITQAYRQPGWNSRAITADKVEDGHTVLSLGLNYGGRRILFDKISLNYTIGIAYPISSSISKLSGNQLLSSKDAIHRFTYDFLKSSRTIKGSIEVGYFF